MPDLPVTIEAVVKITERCNINCTYCYVFNRGDESYLSHDVAMTPETAERLGQFLAEGAKTLGALTVRIDFHGGEPLMMKKARFRALCDTFRRHLPAPIDLRFALQTNAMLVDAEWIEIFREYQIGVGVSLDGPRPLNDITRIDHFGRGTYDRARKGLDLLNEAYGEGAIPSFGMLVVAQPNGHGTDVYRHFVHDAKVPNIDFLLPIDSHEDRDVAPGAAYGTFLCEAFDAWVADDDPLIRVRLFNNTISFLRDGEASAKGARSARDTQYHLFTISSSGHIGPDDSLRTLPLALFEAHTVFDTSLAEFIGLDTQRALADAENTIPDGCTDCAWKNICRGGASNGRILSRFSKANGFNNPSVTCEGLQEFYAHVAAHMLKHGLAYDRLTASLVDSDAGFQRYDEASCPFAEGASAPNGVMAGAHPKTMAAS